MRVLLVSEGKHELGDASVQGGSQGALEVLVRRLGGATESLHFSKRKVSDRRVHAHHGTGKGLEKRALRWILQAMDEDCDALVLLVDEDGDHQRRAEIDDAQRSDHFPLPRALGIAIRSFDAWMLADEVALSRVLGQHVQRQQDPERLEDPKRDFTRLRGESQSELSLAEAYSKIATRVDLETLKQRCPKGFATFAHRVQALTGHV